MAVPKRRRSKSRKRMRKSAWKVEMPNTAACSNCGVQVRPHFACASCGFYDGKQVVQIKSKAVADKDA